MLTEKKTYGVLGLLLVGLGALATGAPVLKPGTERWPVKTSLAPGADPNKATMIPLDAFLAIPPAPGVTDNDKRYQSARIPKAAGEKVGDGDMVKTRGYLRLVAGEPDGDYHIQITQAADTTDNCLVVEVPNPDPEFVKDSKVVLDTAKTVRSFIDTKLLKGANAVGHTIVMQHPAFVEVTGQLFYDDAHVASTEKGVYRGKKVNGKQLPSKTVWEIHPITGMTFAPAPK